MLIQWGEDLSCQGPGVGFRESEGEAVEAEVFVCVIDESNICAVQGSEGGETSAYISTSSRG